MAGTPVLVLRRDRFEKLLRLKGLPLGVTALATTLSMDKGNLSRILAGSRHPSHQFLAAILEQFGVEWFDYLFHVARVDAATFDPEEEEQP